MVDRMGDLVDRMGCPVDGLGRLVDRTGRLVDRMGWAVDGMACRVEDFSSGDAREPRFQLRECGFPNRTSRIRRFGLKPVVVGPDATDSRKGRYGQELFQRQ
jgi:hypothetical protein